MADDQRTGTQQSYSFEEFRLMYETTEKVVERKLEQARSNSSFCSAIIAGQAVALSWAYGKGAAVEIVSAALVAFIACLAILFCLYWYNQIIGSKNLNRAKFKVLDEMAAGVRFPDYKSGEIRSINPFVREWQIMEEGKKLSTKGDRKTNLTEMILPWSFISFFAAEISMIAVWATLRLLGLHVL